MEIQNFVVFDFETGGLDKKKGMHAELVAATQFAGIGIRSNDFKELGRVSEYIKPNYDDKLEYQPEALKFTGTTMEMLEEKGISIDELIEKVIGLFEATNTGTRLNKPILVGQNVNYDIPFLQKIFSYKKIDLSKYLEGYKDNLGTFHPIYMDTKYISRLKFPQEGVKHRLSDLCEKDKVDLVDAHEALNDVIATFEVFKKYLLSLRSESTGASESQEKTFREGFQI